jgi:hypothetical protein
VDAIGLEACHVSARFGARRGESGHRRRAWPKLTAVVRTASHLIVGAVPGVGPSQDSPDFTPAVRRAAEPVAFDTALADAGYDAGHDHRLRREELGMRRAVIALNPRNGSGRRWPAVRGRRHRAYPGGAPVQPALAARSREGTEEARPVAMLRRLEGATVAQVIEVTGWQPHTVRGAIGGALKKKRALEVISEKNEAGEVVYRVAAG